MSKKLLTLIATATLALFTPALSLAAPIVGELDTVGSATVGIFSLVFNCTPIAVAPCPAPANFGNFIVTGGTVSFAPFVGQGGFIQDLSEATTPINQPFTLTNSEMFSTTAGNPVLTPDAMFTLTFIFPGIDGQAGCIASPMTGQKCTPAFPGLVTPANPLGLSAFNLENTQTGSTASFSFSGTVKRISTGEVSNVTGLFTSQFNFPYQTVLADLAANGSVTNAYSATLLAAPVPEPGTIAFLLGGLLLVAAGNVKRFHRK